jgi:hypothetical protein
MIFDDFSLKKADNAIQELHSRSDGDRMRPDSIEATAILFDHIISHLPESYYRRHLESLVYPLNTSLNRDAIESLGYGALVALMRVLQRMAELFPTHAPADIEENIQMAHAVLAKRFITVGDEERARRHLETAGVEKIEDILDGMKPQIDSPAHSATDSPVWIPVTLHPLSSLPSLVTGRMIQGQLGIELTGEWSLRRRYKPVVAFDGRILERDDPFAEQLRAAVSIAEHIFITKNGQRELARLPREYLFAFSGSDMETAQARAYTGGSAGLGFTLLALQEIDRIRFRRCTRRMKRRIAVTGSVAGDGSVMPVDDANIEAKMRAVFFSACTHFVVPEGNRATAEAVLKRLHEEFPNRELELVPVSSVMEAYRDERIFEEERIPAGAIALKKAIRKRKHIIAAVSLIAAVAVMLLLIPPIFVREIHTFRVEHDTLYFINRFGVTFDSYKLGYHVYPCEQQNPGLPPGLVAQSKNGPPVYAYNGFHEDIIPGNGKEFLFVAVAVDPTEKSPSGTIHVHLLSHSRDTLLHITVSDTLRMLEDGKPVEYTKVNLLWNGLRDFDGDGYMELYFVTRNHIWSPSTVHCVSFKDGSIQTFAHYGHFRAFRILDLGNDGKEEIILASVHGHPLNKAVVTVLDPLNMQGTTPTRMDPSFIDFPEDPALLYIMFPQSVMCELLGGECDRPHAMTINPLGNGEIWFGVQEGHTGIMYYFDAFWRCSRVEFINTYISQYNAFRKTHDLKPLEEYAEELREGVRYWDRKSKNWVASSPSNGI